MALPNKSTLHFRDHRKVYVGDSRGRVYCWSLSDVAGELKVSPARTARSTLDSLMNKGGGGVLSHVNSGVGSLNKYLEKFPKTALKYTHLK